MMIKIAGVILVIASCGGVGFRIAANHRKEEKALRQLIGILDYMECELQYRMTPLPELCRQVAREFKELSGRFFYQLALEMESQILPDMEQCMAASLRKAKDVPPVTYKALDLLGHTIGRFDIEGQIIGLETVRQECRRNLLSLSDNRETRLRSYQTLGLCAGAALVILFI